MKQFSSPRIFKIWEFQVSHNQLLLRSPKRISGPNIAEQTTNLDLQFVAVEYVALPSYLQGIELVDAYESEWSSLQQSVGLDRRVSTLFIVLSGGRRFQIAAARVIIRENDWDIFESPLEFRSQFRER